MLYQTLGGETFTLSAAILELTYLIAAIFFVVGLKLLSHPETAKKGNIWAASGMILAMISTLLLHESDTGEMIPLTNGIIVVITILFGSLLGWLVAKRVKMTAMPQLVSFFNASGGIASALVALMKYPAAPSTGILIVALLGLTIGSVSFSGSMIAYGKLDGKVGIIRSPIMKYVNFLFLLVVLGMLVYLATLGYNTVSSFIYGLFVLSLIYGVLFVMPIGGADMPVVISLLNSFTGIAAAMAGFIYGNQAMILGGIFVGAAGSILTVLMCRAMNRSLIKVILGASGGGAGSIPSEEGTIKQILVSDTAILLNYSQRVVIVPGYGLAVAKAQHGVHELDQILEENGVEVKYAIHPVAGRMPGHMNVLLAEAEVPYDKLVKMEDINPQLPNTDVVLVIGANDTVNPAASEELGSPIYGMPIVEAHQAKNVIVMKRGMGKGYAGIENKLFLLDKTRMLFGNAKDSVQKILDEIKSM